MENIPVVSYCNNNTGVEIQDIFKYLYQSCFGCEHLVTDYGSALERICREMDDAGKDDLDETEPLDGDFCRVHLKITERGISPETLCRLFLLSGQTHSDSIPRLEKELGKLIRYAREGIIPFSPEKTAEAAEAWKNANYPPVHHSETFRKKHNPAYRVVKSEFIRMLPLLAETDKRLDTDNGENIIIAIDGRCASGKTTLASRLSEIYDCNVFHMDDFFLRPEQRSEERLNTAGENVDHERFLEEILLPLKQNRDVSFRRFDCHSLRLEAPTAVPKKRLNIIEGSYSFHPSLYDYYDFTVFSDISPELQKERISARNTAEMAEKFFSVWIPLEEKYFNALGVMQKADLII